MRRSIVIFAQREHGKEIFALDEIFRNIVFVINLSVGKIRKLIEPDKSAVQKTGVIGFRANAQRRLSVGSGGKGRRKIRIFVYVGSRVLQPYPLCFFKNHIVLNSR